MMFTQSLVSHAYLSSPDCSSLALRSYWPFRAAALRLSKSQVCAPSVIRRPSSPLRLLIERRQVPRGECFPILKLRGFVQLKVAHARHRLLHLASRTSSRHRASYRCPSATRPRGHCFSSPFPLRCVIFLALVDRHFREQLLPCQGCAGFVGVLVSNGTLLFLTTLTAEFRVFA